MQDTRFEFILWTVVQAKKPIDLLHSFSEIEPKLSAYFMTGVTQLTLNESVRRFFFIK